MNYIGSKLSLLEFLENYKADRTVEYLHYVVCRKS